MTECPFCQIIAGQRKASIIYQDPRVVAFRDVNPQAPTHILIVPTKHISSLNEIESEDHELLGYLLNVARSIAEKEGINEEGYRLVLNCQEKAGQSIFHLHFHMLGGRRMGWPPG